LNELLGRFYREWTTKESRQVKVLWGRSYFPDALEQHWRRREPLGSTRVAREASELMKLIVQLTFKCISLPHGVLELGLFEVLETQQPDWLVIG
jgi:hypothetical protein